MQNLKFTFDSDSASSYEFVNSKAIPFKFSGFYF